MAEITRDKLADVLDDIALLLELKGENPFKIRAYRNGAETVRSFEGDIVRRAAEDDLKGIKGIGDALQQKLHELATTGSLQFHKDLKAEFPDALFELFELPGLGPKKIKILYEKLAIASLGALQRACESGQVATLAGFGEKTASKILTAIDQRQRFAGRYVLAQAGLDAELILGELRQHPAVTRVAVAGSYRRAKETVHDLDFLVSTRDPAAVISWFTGREGLEEIIAQGDTKASVRLAKGLQCDLRAVSDAEFPFALLYFTGSKEHNVALRRLALKQNLTLNEYHLAPVEGAKREDPTPTITTEGDIYRELGLTYIEPELREDRGELPAASAGLLPKLIEQENLRGTFHNHTTESDGRSTLEEMVEAAIDLGLDYLGISDHSKSSFQARGLDEERLLQQIQSIRTLNKDYPGFRIFAGSEVDILKDGTLDFSDDLLAQLDYCVASVHASFSLSENEMTKRVIRAMENPHVTMLGHMTGRLLLRREAYAINHDKIIDCAAATGTVIELNCSSKRMDMDWRWWHRARDKGVKCAINPDAHHASHLQNLHFGVRVARKGWLRREDVLNCLALPEVDEWLRIPKGKRL
ncbi:MAG: DNA polymerase/3'-5' exonuclease PolX [Verrucomicrobia bacterium]|nr:DNA polymerase/3'-5' exonuclease PolX [Verrucomicrobiota bacterium]MDA1005294.1 DNA polymerase/3'-5' exonuclease PolX [Verrucomicrobiota bacterium]